MIVLDIETSCDETAAAVVDGSRHIRSNLVLSQLDEHRPYGGVVPEIAARSHLDHLGRLVERALAEAEVTCAELDGVAATPSSPSKSRSAWAMACATRASTWSRWLRAAISGTTPP